MNTIFVGSISVNHSKNLYPGKVCSTLRTAIELYLDDINDDGASSSRTFSSAPVLRLRRTDLPSCERESSDNRINSSRKINSSAGRKVLLRSKALPGKKGRVIINIDNNFPSR